jgi:signal transduction histidine kinase
LSAGRAAGLALWPAAVAAGLAAEAAGYGWDRPADWLPDLVTGWALIACGAFAARDGAGGRRASGAAARDGEGGRRIGLLLVASGFAWFAGTAFAGAAYWHRGPLLHAVLTFPHGRATGRAQRLAVAAAYAAALIEPVWRSEAATLALAAAMVLVAAAARRDAIGRERRERGAALAATAALATVLAGTALARLAAPTQAATDATLLVYEAALIALAAALAAAVAHAPWDRTRATDLVVELGETRSGTLRDGLARALGDPALEVAYRLPEGGWVDAGGRALAPPEGRRVTEVRRDGEVVAAIVHDAAVLDDPALVEAVGAAARLAAANARLQAELRTQVAEVEASRARLLGVADEERRRLEQRLHERAERRLEALVRELDGEPGLAPARAQLAAALADVRELAAGLHPRIVTEQGLEAALRSLAAAAPVPVDLEAGAPPLPPDAQIALYFACSEALANVTKYAGATRVRVRLAAADGVVRLEVADDGAGGADPARGTGLRGLRDRLEALGGGLEVDSPPGGGTRFVAVLPLREPGSP